MIRRAYRGFVSARVTVTLLCVLALLLLLNVVLPQAAVLGEETVASMVENRPLARLLLVDLGLSRMPTSPVFLAVLVLFFVNLGAVMVSRVGPTLRRTAIRPRSEKGLAAWARLEESLSAPLPAGWDAADSARILRGFGYRVQRPGGHSLFGVKHRLAPVGFLLFHLSFFLLCAGGLLVYYTRFVGSAALTEGQEFAGAYGLIERMPPLGVIPDLRFALDRVEPRFERGEPVHLGVTFRARRAGSTVPLESRINHPARWGGSIVMVTGAGLSPVLWLQDRRGFTVDRVVAPIRGRGAEPTEIPLADGDWIARVFPLAAGQEFPERGDLATTALRVVLTQRSEVLFDGELRVGATADAGERGRLVLEDLRYWANIRVVSERGGSLLILGFSIGVAGLVWRLLWHRREVAVTWDPTTLRLVGRAEYFSGGFRRQLESMRDELCRGAASTRGGER
jgi:hypothetical protein